MSFITNLFKPDIPKIKGAKRSYEISDDTTKLVGKPLTAIYGQARLKGNVVFKHVSDDNKRVRQSIALCWGPVDLNESSIRINSKWPEDINGVKFRGSAENDIISNLKVWTYVGSNGQVGPDIDFSADTSSPQIIARRVSESYAGNLHLKIGSDEWTVEQRRDEPNWLQLQRLSDAVQAHPGYATKTYTVGATQTGGAAIYITGKGGGYPPATSSRRGLSFTNVPAEASQFSSKRAHDYGMNRTSFLHAEGEANKDFSGINDMEVFATRGDLFVSNSGYQTPTSAALIPRRSTNPVAAALDWLMNEDYGAAKDPTLFGDFSTWIAAMDYCDEMVDNGAGGLQPRWSFSGEVGLKDSDTHADVIDYILDHANAATFESNGVIKCWIARPQTPVAYLDRSNFDPKGLESADLMQIPNVVEVTFRQSADGEERRVRFDDTFRLTEFGRIDREIELRGIPDFGTASRMANFRGRAVILRDLALAGTADQRFMGLEPGDCVAVTIGHADATWYQDKLFLVDEIVPDNRDGDIELKLIEYPGDDLFNDSRVAVIDSSDPIYSYDPSTSPLSPQTVPPGVTNVTWSFNIQNRTENPDPYIELSWAHPIGPDFTHETYLIYKRTSLSDVWLKVDVLSGTSTSFRDNLIDVGSVYYYAIVPVTSASVPGVLPSDYTVFVDVPAYLDEIGASGLYYRALPGGAEIMWQQFDDPSWYATEVYVERIDASQIGGSGPVFADALEKGPVAKVKSTRHTLLFRKMSRLDVFEAFMAESVAQITTPDFVTRLYQIWLGRTPTTAESSHWESQLQSLSRASAERAFLNDDGSYGSSSLSDTDFIALIYETFLDRSASADEVEAWNQRLVTTSISRGRLKGEILSSTTVSDLLTDIDYIDELYETYLQRAASVDETESMLGMMNTAGDTFRVWVRPRSASTTGEPVGPLDIEVGKVSYQDLDDDVRLDLQKQQPDTPTDVVATPIVNGISLSWRWPNVDAQYVDVWYIVAGSNTPLSDSPQLVASGTSAEIYGLADYTAYSFYLQARNGPQLKSPVVGPYTSMPLTIQDSFQNATPGVPTNLTVMTRLGRSDDGQTHASLYIAWAGPDYPYISHYQVQVEGSGSDVWVSYQADEPVYEVAVLKGIPYCIRVRTIAENGIPSPYTSKVCVVGILDNVPPGDPTNLNAVAGFNAIWVNWTNPSDRDLRELEVVASPTNDREDPASKIYKTAGTLLPETSLQTGVSRYYWVRAIDTSGNPSDWVGPVTATTTSLQPIDFPPTFGPIPFGDTLPDTPDNGVTYFFKSDEQKLYRWNGTGWQAAISGIDIQDDSISAVHLESDSVTSGKISTASLQARHVGANEIIAEQTNVKDATITSAKIVNLEAAKIYVPAGASGLPPGLTIGEGGVTIGDLQDPAQFINAGTTTIQPGKIEISGGTTLDSWRDGTQINGGVVSANSLRADALVIGSRRVATDVQFYRVNDVVHWTGGSLYIEDDSVEKPFYASWTPIPYAGQQKYIYWQDSASTASLLLNVSTNKADALGADRIHLATATNVGGVVSINSHHGSTIIDGDMIQAGTIKADNLQAGSITTNELEANIISAENFIGGTINTSDIVLGSGQIVMSSQGNVIEVSDNTGTRRLNIGRIGLGDQDYGIQITDKDGYVFIDSNSGMRGAWIENLSVGTLQIADSAITSLAYSIDESNIQLNNNTNPDRSTWLTGPQITFTSTGAPIYIEYVISMTPLAGSYSPYGYTEVYRSPGYYKDWNNRPVVAWTNLTSFGINITNLLAGGVVIGFSGIDQPPAGVWTYWLGIACRGDGPVEVASRSLYLEELKK